MKKLFIFLLCLFPLVCLGATEDFTTYTEVDGGAGSFTITDSRCAWTTISTTVTSYVYRDMGVDYFSGDFTHTFTAYTMSLGDTFKGATWAISNSLDDLQSIYTDKGDVLHVTWYDDSETIVLYEYHNGGSVSDSFDALPGTPYYCVVERDDDGNGGTGVTTCKIYDDAEKTNLVGDLSINNSGNYDYRYIMPFVSSNHGGAPNGTGYMEDLDLGDPPAGASEPTPPIITIMNN